MVARGASIILGLWLLLSGATFPLLRESAFPQWILALVILAAEVLSLAWKDDFRWITFLAAVWLLFAPWSLGYPHGGAAVNSIIVGLALLILAPIPNHPAFYTPPTSYWHATHGGDQTSGTRARLSYGHRRGGA